MNYKSLTKHLYQHLVTITRGTGLRYTILIINDSPTELKNISRVFSSLKNKGWYMCSAITNDISGSLGSGWKYTNRIRFYDNGTKQQIEYESYKLDERTHDTVLLTTADFQNAEDSITQIF